MRIAKAGYPFIIYELIVGILAFWALQHSRSAAWATIYGAVSGLAFLLAAFCAYFFRDPKRVVPKGDGLVLSPADGRIVAIEEGRDAAYAEPVWIMRIFLSVFDPHIQRMPVAGTVRKITYKTGKFLDARHPQAHFENEQNRLEIEPAGRLKSTPIIVTQIAGLIARRIVCWVSEGQSLETGAQFGLIRFGSQVDVVFPKSVRFKVKAGDRVEAGSTILADIP